MQEEKKIKRADIEMPITLHRILDGDRITYNAQVKTICREEMGFFSDTFLEVQEYYDTELFIDQEIIKTVVKIIHCDRSDGGGFVYDSEFIGMAEQDKFRIDVYQIVMNKEIS